MPQVSMADSVPIFNAKLSVIVKFSTDCGATLYTPHNANPLWSKIADLVEQAYNVAGAPENDISLRIQKIVMNGHG